eukprot:6845386-Prymnesium_polylepis.1
MRATRVRVGVRTGGEAHSGRGSQRERRARRGSPARSAGRCPGSAARRNRPEAAAGGKAEASTHGSR